MCTDIDRGSIKRAEIRKNNRIKRDFIVTLAAAVLAQAMKWSKSIRITAIGTKKSPARCSNGFG